MLISAEGKVFLADYGVVAPVEHVTGGSQVGSPERERVRRRHAAVVSTFTGTPAWMAPEVVLERRPLHAPADCMPAERCLQQAAVGQATCFGWVRHCVCSLFQGAVLLAQVVAPDEAVGYDERADIWSFGILLLELAHGAVSFQLSPIAMRTTVQACFRLTAVFHSGRMWPAPCSAGRCCNAPVRLDAEILVCIPYVSLAPSTVTIC